MYQLVNDKLVAPIPSGELILLGRGELCDIQCEDPSASRVHCRFLSKAGKVFLSDAGSRWGTFVNGERVQEAELDVGDLITIGDTVFELSHASDPYSSTVRPRDRQPQNDLDDELFLEKNIAISPARFGEIANGKHLAGAVDNPVSFVPDSYLNKRFLRYQMQELLAHTRTGMVFKAEDAALNRTVAIKLFRPDLLEDETDKNRFLRAVQTMIEFRHPHIVQLFDAGESAGVCYTINEFVSGSSAAELIQSIGIAGMLDWRTTLQIGIDLCESLDVIHQQGVVHRNIRPEHILIRKENKHALLGEVTLAKAWNREHLEEITQGGDVVGDLCWQSPEQLGNGEPVDHRSDLFQLGLTLYALLTGKHPFRQVSSTETINHILQLDPQPVRSVNLSVPDLLEDVVLKLLSKQPKSRYASAFDLGKHLQSVNRYSS